MAELRMGEHYRLRWRDYRTVSGNRPVNDFYLSLPSDEQAVLYAALAEVAATGLSAARHVRDAIYEVRAQTRTRSFRVLFSHEAKFILLSLSAFEKRTQRTPTREIDLAMRRLRDWRERGRHRASSAH